MNKVLKKGATGAVVYVQKIHINEQQNTPSTPLQQLLDSFSDVFAAPSQLPPQREVDHKIPLQQGADIVNTRPYRLSHSQKDIMEALIL
jgi:hypothetical protein